LAVATHFLWNSLYMTLVQFSFN